MCHVPGDGVGLNPLGCGRRLGPGSGVGTGLLVIMERVIGPACGEPIARFLHRVAVGNAIKRDGQQPILSEMRSGKAMNAVGRTGQ